ncbi:MAG: glycosyltransferase, partial [Vicinamibacterales bacterium]
EIIEPTRHVGRLGLQGLLSPVPRHHAQTFSPSMQRAVDTALGSNRFEVAVGLQLDAAAYLARAAAAIPIVFEEAELSVLRDRYVAAESARTRVRNGLTWWKYRRYVRTLSRACALTTVVSEKERAMLIEIGGNPKRIAVVPNGVEIGSRPRDAVRLERVIYPGSVTYVANLDAVTYFVQDILPLLRRSVPHLEFWVTGETRGIDIEALSRAPGVVFTGRVADVTPLIAQSAACVVPLRIGGGTRLKILHAMAAGAPVVATHKGMEGLRLEPGRHLLTAENPQDFAAAVLRLLREPDLASDLANAAFDCVATDYDWKTICAQFSGLLGWVSRESKAERR